MEQTEYEDETLTIKRELWKNGLHSVVRNEKGHIKRAIKWHGRESTESNIEFFRRKKRKGRLVAPKPPPKKPRYRITVEVQCKRTRTVSRHPSREKFSLHFSVLSGSKGLSEYNMKEIRQYFEHTTLKSGGTVELTKVKIHRIYDLLMGERVL